MKPIFTDPLAWQQAELLMQPAFIRLIDNIRKQLDESSWKGTYQDVQLWPAGTTPDMQATVTQLQQQLEGASPEQAAEIEQTLSNMPAPYPGYRLCLQHQDQQVTVDLWDLCYQICFRNYQPVEMASPADIDTELRNLEIDTSLIDETGDVDWHRLDAKAQQIVEQVFNHLPANQAAEELPSVTSTPEQTRQAQPEK